MLIIPLPLHLFIHFALAVLAGYLVGRRYDKIWLGLIAGVSGGFFIDLDHVLEYFLVFGPHFNFLYFIEGREFLTSNQIHIWFHAWEYVPLLLLAAWLFRQRKSAYVFLLALALGIFIHLATDGLINQYPPQNYSLFYRMSQNFSAQKLLSAEQYQKYIEDRQEFGM